MKPTARCVALFVAGVPLALVVGLIHVRLWSVWIAYLGATIVAAGIDLLFALPRRRVRVDVDAPDQLYIGDTGSATITITGRRWRRGARILVPPHLDPDLSPQQ